MPAKSNGRLLKDGKPHRARIEFAPPHLKVLLDGGQRPVLTAIVDLAPMLDAGGKAYVGFTASTGGGYANHDIESWDWRPDVSSSISAVSSQITFALAECLPGRNLCTPARAAGSEPSPGRFHVVLPGHLEDGAGIPNPEGRQPVVTNGNGIVCLGPGESGRANCAGPAELLTVRSGGGRTYFAVRGATAVAPALRQGFFEFDVEFDQ